jgi:FlaA1/EpsC-like NDP-sugar epimerase
MEDIVSGKVRIGELKELAIEDLLGRESVAPNQALLEQHIRNKVVMVTGAGGSIGSELCRQIVSLKPKSLLLFESSEFALYAINKELSKHIKKHKQTVDLIPLLGSVQHKQRLFTTMQSFGVQTVYHAAAYKHVPIVENNMVEGIRNNVFGTWYAAEAAVTAGVEKFVLVSTDKAVRPTNIMGTTKRLAELVLQAINQRGSDTIFTMVRFGNVLGSSGSVVPLFREQIEQGGPVTVTHKDITRYFMTIPEASQLVIQAGSMGKGGDVFVLDMGEPVKIGSLAHRIIHLMGRTVKTEENPNGEIAIDYTGLRPGEKLYEELLVGENVEGTEHKRIMTASEESLSWENMEKALKSLDALCISLDCEGIVQLLLRLPTGYNPQHAVCDLVWSQDKDNQNTSEKIVDFKSNS